MQSKIFKCCQFCSDIFFIDLKGKIEDVLEIPGWNTYFVTSVWLVDTSSISRKIELSSIVLWVNQYK